MLKTTQDRSEASLMGLGRHLRVGVTRGHSKFDPWHHMGLLQPTCTNLELYRESPYQGLERPFRGLQFALHATPGTTYGLEGPVRRHSWAKSQEKTLSTARRAQQRKIEQDRFHLSISDQEVIRNLNSHKMRSGRRGFDWEVWADVLSQENSPWKGIQEKWKKINNDTSFLLLLSRNVLKTLGLNEETESQRGQMTSLRSRRVNI